MGLTPLVLLASASLSHGSSETSHANPIRRVVTLLQKMQTTVSDEGKKEEELFEKFMCYCKNGAGDLKASIKAAENKIGADSASLEEAEAQAAQLTSDLVEHKANRADAKDATAKAVALRKKEAATFAKDSSDLKTNIAALGKAIVALEKGAAGGSFLQSQTASTLRQLTINMDMSEVDRDALTAFLSQGAGYVPQGGEITGILKQMSDTMKKDLADITAAEEQAIKDFDALVAAKAKEIATNQRAIETKTERLGQTNVDIVNLKEEVDDAAKALKADKAFLANLGSSCDTKATEWEERSKMRNEELAALAETIRLLNDDDALDLFKKTLPSPSLIQVQFSATSMQRKALTLLKASHGRKDPRMDLVMLALTGKSKNFDNVLKMIDEMTALLGREQVSDDDKKAYCESNLDKSEDELKALDNTIEDLNKAIATDTDNIARLGEEISALIAGIKALDGEVTDATANRKAENSEYKATMAANGAARELIGLAKNRMNKFYNPDLYKEPEKIELSREQRIAVNEGSEAAPTVAPSGIAGTGITYFAQVSSHDSDKVAPAPPPETWGAYQKKGGAHNGVTAMLDLLVADVDKEMQTSKVDEKNAQSEYETFMSDSQAKRAQDSKSVADKEGMKADAEARLEKMQGEHKATTKEAYNTATTIKDLHLECDWLLSSFEARKEARAGEVDSLSKAKAVLSGADYSLLQSRRERKQLRGAF